MIAFMAHMLLVMLIALSKIFEIDEPILWSEIKNKMDLDY
jgi:hypothetical protein